MHLHLMILKGCVCAGDWPVCIGHVFLLTIFQPYSGGLRVEHPLPADHICTFKPVGSGILRQVVSEARAWLLAV